MLHPLQLFKTLSDETRLAIVMLLREASYAYAISAPQPPSLSLRSPATWRCCASPGWLSTVAREVGLLPFVSQHACMGGNRYRQQLELPAGRDAHEA